MRLETRVAGDPSACYESARQLDALADATDGASALLGQRSAVSTADFGGRSGDAFRHHAARLAERLSGESGHCRRIGWAMAQLAHDLDRVVALMEECLRTARARRLVVEDAAIVLPGAYADADQHRAWRELRAVVAGIRELEQRAQRDWQQALTRETGVPPTSTPTPLPAGLPGPDETNSPPRPSAPAGAPTRTAPAPPPPLAAAPAPTGDPVAATPAPAPAPATVMAERLGQHAEVWQPALSGTVAFEEVRDESC